MQRSPSFSLMKFISCLFTHHKWRNSNSRPGYVTCVRCGYRKRF